MRVTENQQKAIIYYLTEVAKVNEEDRQSFKGNWEMGGALFSNFYFHIHAKNKGQNKRKVPLELLGELAHLFSVLCVGIKDLSANNLFQYSLCHFPLLPPVIHRGFCGRIPNDKYCTFIKS